MAVSPALRRVVVERDKKRCAYCQTSEENCGLAMHLDHVIPEAAGGVTAEGNLCLACFSCNVAKGARQFTTDLRTGALVLFYDPVRERWNDHFGCPPKPWSRFTTTTDTWMRRWWLDISECRRLVPLCGSVSLRRDEGSF